MSYTFFKDHLSSTIGILMCAILLFFYASGTVNGMLLLCSMKKIILI